MKKSVCLLIVLLVLTLTSIVSAADWPQFRGQNRDGKSPETGLLKKWPEAGPKLLWSVEGQVGEGFASVTVVDGMVYTTGMTGDKDKQETLFAYDTNGNFKWKQSYGPAWTKSHPGTRTTPTVDGDRLYVMSGNGLIVCFDAKNGKEIWKVDTAEVFKGKNIKWGITESLLIYKDRVICTPGGEDATMVALDKMTGKTIWTTKGISEKSAYCSPVVIKRGSRDLVVSNVQKSVIIVDPENGNVVCRIPHEKRHELAAVSPLYHDGNLYITTGYTREGMPDRGILFELSDDTSKFSQVWTERKLDCHHGGLIFLNGLIYGSDSAIYPPAKSEKPKGTWYALEMATGQIKYSAKLIGKGSVIYADGMLYCLGETGTLALVKLTENSLEIVSSFPVTLDKTEECWAHPSISDGRLYIRYLGNLMVYDIKGQ
ncbi:MAG: outer membrane protein assembly factor BamB family protein [Planctomycetota bacterium]|jgi:outer membrane protein assembly factor BamB